MGVLTESISFAGADLTREAAGEGLWNWKAKAGVAAEEHCGGG